MMVERTWLVRGVVAAVAVVMVWAAWEYSPGRQLEKAFLRLITAAENRDWKTVRAGMAETYRDQWGFDRDESVRLASEVLGQFLTLQITCENLRVSREGDAALVETRLRLRGRGNAVGEALMQRANALQDDFRFAWRRESWKPWSWKLVSLSQNEIDPTEIL